jgi:hypothetical protein
MERFNKLMALEIAGELGDSEKAELLEILNNSAELSEIAVVLRKEWKEKKPLNRDVNEMLTAHQKRMKDKGFI